MPRSSSALAPPSADIVRRFITTISLPSQLTADQSRSDTKTSIIGVMFRQRADFGRDPQRLSRVGVEERPQVGITTDNLRDVECANPYVLEESDDLFISFRNPLFDEWQTALTIDRMQGLEDHSV